MLAWEIIQQVEGKVDFCEGRKIPSQKEGFRTERRQDASLKAGATSALDERGL
jgi:hypothetical protein